MGLKATSDNRRSTGAHLEALSLLALTRQRLCSASGEHGGVGHRRLNWMRRSADAAELHPDLGASGYARKSESPALA